MKRYYAIILVLILVVFILFFIANVSLTNNGCVTDNDCIYTCHGCMQANILHAGTDNCTEKSLCKCINSRCVFAMNDDYIRKKTGIKGGEVDFYLDNKNTNCNNCGTWHVRIKSNYTNISLLFQASTGQPVGVGSSSGNENINKFVPHCRYMYNIVKPEYEFLMINPDCANPKPFCDRELEVCRHCENSSECIRENITTYVPLDIGVVFKRYEISAINVNANATYDEQFGNCLIYYNRTIVYNNETDIDMCRSELINYVKCSSGICKGAV